MSTCFDGKEKAGAAAQWLDLGLSHMRESRFGDAINALMQAARTPGASEEIVKKAQAAIEVINDINGFVNTDLMNP